MCCSARKAENVIIVEAGFKLTTTLVCGGGHNAGSEASSIHLPMLIVLMTNEAAGGKPQPYDGWHDVGREAKGRAEWRRPAPRIF